MIHISSLANVCVCRHEDLGKKYYSLDPEKKRKKDKKNWLQVKRDDIIFFVSINENLTGDMTSAMTEK